MEKIQFKKPIEKTEEVEEEKTKIVKKPFFELVQVPTEHRLAYQTLDGEIITTEELLTWMANEIFNLKKAIVG